MAVVVSTSMSILYRFQDIVIYLPKFQVIT